jgi:glycosyltransferase involved in cell wall biosynthesis
MTCAAPAPERLATAPGSGEAAATVLVVPCFNEQDRLPVAGLRDGLARDPTLAYVLVDDGSTDATRARLEEVRRGFEARVRVESLRENAGKGAAVRHGVLCALGDGPRFVGYWDADLATPLAAVEDLREVLERRPQVLLVMGSRLQSLGRRVRRSALRHYAGRVMATLIARAIGLAVYDTQCGAKLLRAGPEAARLFEQPFLSRWLFDVEILARLARLHREGAGGAPEAVVHEHPLEEWSDVPGSKVRPMDFPRALADLRRIRRAYGRSARGGAAAPGDLTPPPSPR